MATVCGVTESDTTEHASKHGISVEWNTYWQSEGQSTSWDTMWISLNWILLSARSQIQKATYYMVPLNDILENVYNFRDKRQISDCQELVLGRETDYEGAGQRRFWSNVVILYHVCSGGYTTLCICWDLLQCTPREVNVTVCKLKKNSQSTGGTQNGIL